jgi:hypothetical protein
MEANPCAPPPVPKAIGKPTLVGLRWRLGLSEVKVETSAPSPSKQDTLCGLGTSAQPAAQELLEHVVSGWCLVVGQHPITTAGPAFDGCHRATPRRSSAAQATSAWAARAGGRSAAAAAAVVDRRSS